MKRSEQSPPDGVGDNRAGTDTVGWTLLETPIGPLLLAATEQGLVNVVLRADKDRAAAALDRLAGRLGSEPEPAPDRLAEPVRQLEAYFTGELRAFTLDLDWSLTSGFNRRVLRELSMGVPYGSVAGYQDLADRIGERGAARAVGMAMGANPLPVVVPCHRVVESGGGIGGFARGLDGGLEIKRTLLSLEGVLPQPLF